MNNPTIVDLSKTGSQTYWSFSPNQDVIFLGASTTDTNSKLQVQGGHNVMLLGGDFQPHGQATGTLQFDGLTGAAWVDGVHIDNKFATGGQDAIDFAGAAGTQPDLTVQNSLIENVNGAKSSGHADVVQTQGPAGNLHFYNLTGTTNYQGLFISPQYQPETKSATLDNVNLSYTGATTNDGSAFSYLLWTLDDKSETPYPISFHNVNVVPRAGETADQTVWPTSSMGAVQNGNSISFPNMPYTGSVTLGAPAANYADSSKLGLHFTDAQTIVNAVTTGGTLVTVGASTGSGSGSTGSGSTGGSTGSGSTGSGSTGSGSTGGTAHHGTLHVTDAHGSAVQHGFDGLTQLMTMADLVHQQQLA